VGAGAGAGVGVGVGVDGGLEGEGGEYACMFGVEHTLRQHTF